MKDISTHEDSDGTFVIDKELLLTLADGSHAVGVYIGHDGVHDTDGDEIPIGFYWIHPENGDLYSVGGIKEAKVL